VVSLCSPAQLNVKLGGVARHRLDTRMVELLRSRVSMGATAEMLLLGNATGVKGRSFRDSITGHSLVLVVEDYTGQRNVIPRMVPWHSDKGHRSNDALVIHDDVKKIKAVTKDRDLVISLFGVGVSGKNARIYLFNGGNAPDINEVLFFEPFVATVLPDIGVLNHVGDLDRIRQS
jgi:hypothetical protein